MNCRQISPEVLKPGSMRRLWTASSRASFPLCETIPASLNGFCRSCKVAPGAARMEGKAKLDGRAGDNCVDPGTDTRPAVQYRYSQYIPEAS